MSYNDPTLRVRLTNFANGRVRKEHFGDKGYYSHVIGVTRVHIEQGIVYAEITWGIDGHDMPVSLEVKGLVDSYVVTSKIAHRADGIYVTRDKDKKVLARARSTTYTKDQSDVYVSGKKRKDVLKLFELLRDGKIRPDVELEEFKQIEGSLGELRRLRRLVPKLEGQVESRNGTITRLKDQLKNVRAELTEAQVEGRRKCCKIKGLEAEMMELRDQLAVLAEQD